MNELILLNVIYSERKKIKFSIYCELDIWDISYLKMKIIFSLKCIHTDFWNKNICSKYKLTVNNFNNFKNNIKVKIN